MIRRIACLLVVPSLFAAVATAQEGIEFPQPGEEHKHLAQEAGVWDADVKFWMDPSAEPQVSKGVETNTMVGGFWMVSEFKSQMLGQPFTGHGQYGYDPVKKKYVGTWVDSMTPHLSILEGEVNEKGELVMISKAIDFMTKQESTSKMISRMNDDGTRHFEMHAPIGEGEWMKVMEIHYTKRK